PSTVTANVVDPDGVPQTVDTGGREPGLYRFPWTDLAAEGTWHWNVTAVDDLQRPSTIDRTFVVDLTLSALHVPRAVQRTFGVNVRFNLSRPARVTLRIETKLGVLVKALPPVQLAAGDQALRWDAAHLTKKTKAYPGAYVARVIAKSEIGTMDLSAPFT